MSSDTHRKAKILQPNSHNKKNTVFKAFKKKIVDTVRSSISYLSKKTFIRQKICKEEVATLVTNNISK